MIRRPGPGAMPVGGLVVSRVEPRPLEDASEAVHVALARLVKDAGARCALLLARDGRVLAEAGTCAREVREDIRAGAAASFEVARLMRVVFGREGVLATATGALVEVTPVNDAMAVGTAYERAADLGRVRCLAASAAGELACRMADCR